MNSTMTRTASAVDLWSSDMCSDTTGALSARLRTDAVLLPAATAAPAALVIAVEVPVSQETSALRAFVPADYAVPAVAAHVQKNARTQGPPTRGTPV